MPHAEYTRDRSPWRVYMQRRCKPRDGAQPWHTCSQLKNKNSKITAQTTKLKIAARLHNAHLLPYSHNCDEIALHLHQHLPTIASDFLSAVRSSVHIARIQRRAVPLPNSALARQPSRQLRSV